MLHCFICGEEVTDEDNEGDDENGLCGECAPILEAANLDLEEAGESD